MSSSTGRPPIERNDWKMCHSVGIGNNTKDKMLKIHRPTFTNKEMEIVTTF